ncbi:hypothetical protein C8J57DRAFT_1449329 [Mycena rebaudengoi]|nr:hypothetical protein C8J57DRAFT_1449329 [Mycena rebaudengoi]
MVANIQGAPTTNGTVAKDANGVPLEWDWDIEHADRKLEAKADAALHGATPFEVDRRVLKDVVLEHMRTPVVRIVFLGAGTFHKAYLVTLASSHQVIARVARRFMPRLKTESEIATLRYLREKTQVPVPYVHCYDSNPYNRLGGEYIIMSKAPGVPLSQVYHSMSYAQLVQLLANLARLIVPLFGHRFPHIGSLYSGPDPTAPSNTPTPTLTRPYSAFPFSPTLTPHSPSAGVAGAQQFHVGPIISWPFFGTHRGDLPAVRRPAARTRAPPAGHKLHLDPAEIRSSRHHRVPGVPGDESDESDEWGLEESEDEWEGPGDVMYTDYRRGQRATFLVAHMQVREDAVRRELGRWMRVVDRLKDEWRAAGRAGGCWEEFALDAHDLSLENVFVDPDDPSTITCVIDWESTTTRPLWASAHLPAFLQSSPFTAKLFREAIARLAAPRPPSPSTSSMDMDIPSLAREWLHHERTGMRLRMAHRVVEWDGWEEGLVDSILGPEEFQEEWFHDHDQEHDHEHDTDKEGEGEDAGAQSGSWHGIGKSLSRRREAPKAATKAKVGTSKGTGKLFAKDLEKEKEQMLETTGDICGGRGGELGRKTGGDGAGECKRWSDDDEDDKENCSNGYEAEGED